MTVVANAGPLIALATIGRFDLLRTLYAQVHVPPAVRNEVVFSGPGRPGADEARGASWLQVLRSTM